MVGSDLAYRATSRLPASIFALGKELEEQAMAKGMIMISAPVPSQKKIIIFQYI